MTDVLIIDDDRDIALLLQEVLALESYTTAQVANGQEALDWLSREVPPRAIIVDLAMPEMDGPTLIKRLKQMPHLRNIPILVTTAERQPAALLHGLPIAGLLPKPFHLDALLDQISHVMIVPPLAA